mmetsp:Transcript_67192/g.217151  ORF Transcript_67192/g.217151 Transcript_67192/m.217151 type:complete len:254 (-) Transcript_67192:152-913(-)
MPPPEVQNYPVENLDDSSAYLDGDVVLVGGNWQHIPSISNWLQGANITTLAEQARKFGNLNANGVDFIPVAAKFGVAWAKYVFQGDNATRSAILQEGTHTQKYCNLISCAGFAMPGTGEQFGTCLKRAGGTQANDIKCVEKKVLVDWRHRGRLIAHADEIEQIDRQLGPQLLSKTACTPAVHGSCNSETGPSVKLFGLQTQGLQTGFAPTSFGLPSSLAALVLVSAACLVFAAGLVVGRRSSPNLEYHLLQQP